MDTMAWQTMETLDRINVKCNRTKRHPNRVISECSHRTPGKKAAKLMDEIQLKGKFK
jgi:hypothetical protein